jgi:hypothetical protein
MAAIAAALSACATAMVLAVIRMGDAPQDDGGAVIAGHFQAGAHQQRLERFIQFHASRHGGSLDAVKLTDGRDDLDIFLAREFGNGFRRFLGRDIDAARLCRGGDGEKHGNRNASGKPVLAL